MGFLFTRLTEICLSVGSYLVRTCSLKCDLCMVVLVFHLGFVKFLLKPFLCKSKIRLYNIYTVTKKNRSISLMKSYQVP